MSLETECVPRPFRGPIYPAPQFTVTMLGSKCSNCAVYSYHSTYVKATLKRGPPKGYAESLKGHPQKMESLLQCVHACPPLEQNDPPSTTEPECPPSLVPKGKGARGRKPKGHTFWDLAEAELLRLQHVYQADQQAYKGHIEALIQADHAAHGHQTSAVSSHLFRANMLAEPPPPMVTPSSQAPGTAEFTSALDE
ncbi:hypothetical protein JB92DRAFT_3111261 [Gautieria morchelliformis]|nr:hypothetical protein JB92DRAFT_3111261 [Gautieria morchelliformis]